MIRVVTAVLAVPATTNTRWQVPKGLMWFTIQCRTAVNVLMSHLENKVAASVDPYYTIKSGAVLSQDNIEGLDPHQDFYFSATSAVVLEIMMGIRE